MLSRPISGMDGGFLLGRGHLVVTRTSRQYSACEVPSSKDLWGVLIAKHGSSTVTVKVFNARWLMMIDLRIRKQVFVVCNLLPGIT